MKNRFKCYKLKIGENKDIVFIFGRVYLFENDKLLSEKELLKLITNKGFDNTIRMLWGQFSLIYCDVDSIRIVQSPIADLRDLWFYWSINDECWCISDSLRYLINESKEIFDVNQKAVEDFINFGFVFNHHTLLNKVYKAASPYVYILKENGIFNYSLVDYCLKKESVNTSYLQLLNNSIVLDDVKSAITLSSGFDSNFLLYFLSKKFINGNVYAMSVGGIKGRNETPIVEEICNYYNNVTLYTSVINSEIFHDFPKIVYLLEGSVFERGCFLQYELSKVAKSNRIKAIIGGEGADQIMRNSFSLGKVFRNNFDDLINYWHDFPQDVLRNIVIKKSGMMMTGNNIDCIYPYLSSDFYFYYSNNSFEKEHHKEIIQKYLPIEVSTKLKKFGGSTNLELLFDKEITYERIHRIASKTPYNNIKRLKIKNYKGIDDDFEYDLKIIYILIFKLIFCSGETIPNSLDDLRDINYYLELIENELS